MRHTPRFSDDYGFARHDADNGFGSGQILKDVDDLVEHAGDDWSLDLDQDDIDLDLLN